MVREWYRRVSLEWHRLFWYSVITSVVAQMLALYARHPNWDILNETYGLGLLPPIA